MAGFIDSWRLKAQRLEMVGQQCPHCGWKIFPPKGICPHCHESLTESESKSKSISSGNEGAGAVVNFLAGQK